MSDDPRREDALASDSDDERREVAEKGPLSPGPREMESGRYETVAEVARGGVGVILKCRDVELGRDVAMKVLQDTHADNPQLLERFVEEAQIGGQLQHPGIVPVYEMGLNETRQPYFTMKLVKGKTLAALLEERAGPDDGQRRLLRMFETICMTMGYAHARGVIHRDLKPANIIVGAFGEVLVVDWGFAKVLGRWRVADEQKAKARHATPETIVQTVRSGSEPGSASGSVAGSVMGTPSYMPPEQALGDVDAMDARSDVFGLGALLCEILTGEPPYPPGELNPLVQAAQARLDGAFERLDQCGAAPDLIALAKRCLDPVQANRPEDGSAVGRAVSDHASHVKDRVLAARMEAIEARTKAEGERNRRRLVIGLAAILVLGVATFIWANREREAKVAFANRAVTRTLEDAGLFHGRQDWDAALAKIAEATESSAEADDETRARIGDLEDRILADRSAADARAEAERNARAMVYGLDDLRASWGDGYDAETRASEFARLLADLDAEAIRGHPNPGAIRLALAAWGERSDLLAQVDDDPLRAEIRGLGADGLLAFLLDGRWKGAEPETMALLAGRLESVGGADAIADLHRAILAIDETQWFSKAALGYWLTRTTEPQVGEAIGYLLAAAGQRPERPAARYWLARILSKGRDFSSALRQWRALFEIDPDHADARHRYLSDLFEKMPRSEWTWGYDTSEEPWSPTVPWWEPTAKQLEEMIPLVDEALRVAPRDASVLRVQGDLAVYLADLEGARAAYAASIEARPEDPRTHGMLAYLDMWDGDFESAEGRARRARQLSLEQPTEAALKAMKLKPGEEIVTGAVLAVFNHVMRLRLHSDPEKYLDELERAPLKVVRGETQRLEEMLGLDLKTLEGQGLGQQRTGWFLDLGRDAEAMQAVRDYLVAQQKLTQNPMMAQLMKQLEQMGGGAAVQAEIEQRASKFSWEISLEFGYFEQAVQRLQAAIQGRADPATKAGNSFWIAILCERLGRVDAARAAWGQALELSASLIAGVPEDKRDMWSGFSLAQHFREAPATLREAWVDRVLAAVDVGRANDVRMVAERQAQGDDSLGTVDDTAHTWDVARAMTLSAAGRHADALPLFDQLAPMHATFTADVDLLSWYAISLAESGRTAEARAAVERVERWKAIHPWKERKLLMYRHFARARQVGVSLDLEAARAKVDLCRRQLADVPDDLSKKLELAEALGAEGDLHRRTRDPLAAAPAYEERLGLLQDLVDADGASTALRAALPEVHAKVAWILNRRGDRQGALAHCLEALPLHERLVVELPNDVERKLAFAGCHASIASLLRGLEKPEEARVHRMQELELREAAAESGAQPLAAWLKLADARRRAGRYAAAVEAFDRALAMSPSAANYRRATARRESTRVLAQARAAKPSGPALVITAVSPGSQASALGLEPGDVILSINGVSIEALQGFREVWVKVAAGETANMVIGRVDERIEVSPKGGRVGITLTDIVDD